MSENYFTTVNPQSENDVNLSFETVKERLASAPPAQIPFMVNTVTKINAFTIDAAITARDASLVVQVEDTRLFDLGKFVVIKLIKQFVDELNFNIDLRGFPFNSGFHPSDRQYYGIPNEKTTYPTLNTFKQIDKTYKKFVNGEKQRIADGKPAMKSVTWQIMELWGNNMVTRHNNHINSFNTAKEKQVDVNNIVQDYINNIYPEMKADAISFYRALDKDAARLKMTEWGILYREVTEDSDLFSTVRGYTTYDGSPVDDVEITFAKWDMTIKSNEAGYYSSNEVPIGITDVIVKRLPYKDQIIPDFEIKEDQPNQLNIELEME